MAVDLTRVRMTQIQGTFSPSRRYNVYFQDGHWLTALLTALLYLILAAALDAAGHVASLALLIPVAAGAYLLGLLMSFSRFDGFFALSHSLFVGLAWILYLLAWAVPAAQVKPFLDNSPISELQARVYFVLLRLLDWIEAALNRSASADNYVFIFEIAFLVWWLAYLGVWSIFRYGYTWRAVVPAGGVLLINTYYAPRPTLGFLVVFVLVALVLLVRTHLAEEQLRWREQRIYFQPEIVWDFLRNGLLLSVLLVLAAWLLPGLGRSAQVRSLLQPVNSSWATTAEVVQRLYQGLNRQPTDRAPTFGNSLTLGGGRTVTDTPLFQAQTGQARYWRAVVFDTYRTGRWVNTASESRSFAAGEILPIASWRARTAVSQTITLLAPAGRVLLGMPELAQSTLDLEATVRVQAGASVIPAAGSTDGPVEFTIVRARRELDNGDRYTVVSAAAQPTMLDLQAAGQMYPPAISTSFLQLPDDFSPAVAELARQLTASATTPYAQAKAIEGYLRTLPYNDAIPAPPAGRDPLEYFLFDLRQGYCDYYATAMATMLRVVGVPARAVSGYAEGTFDPEKGLYLVTERDAHTWVEVFFPEYGWIEFEPTAGESSLERPSGVAQPDVGVQLPTPTVAADRSVPTPAPTEPQLPPPFTGEELLDGAQPTATGPQASWLLTLLALAIAVPLGLLWIWRVRSSGPTVFTAELPLVVYERLERWSQRLGLPMQPTATPNEHARALAGLWPTAEPLVQEVTAAYVRFRFGGGQGETDQTGTLLWQRWQTLEALFWKAWWQRWRRRLRHWGRGVRR